MNLPGDIVEVQFNNGNLEMMLILCNHSAYATATRVVEEMPQENGYCIDSVKGYYIDTGRSGYLYHNTILDWVATVSADEMDTIRKEIYKSMGGDFEEPEQPGVVLLPNTARVMPKEDYSINERVIRLETERDIYKELYTKLIEKRGA